MGFGECSLLSFIIPCVLPREIVVVMGRYLLERERERERDLHAASKERQICGAVSLSPLSPLSPLSLHEEK